MSQINKHDSNFAKSAGGVFLLIVRRGQAWLCPAANRYSCAIAGSIIFSINGSCFFSAKAPVSDEEQKKADFQTVDINSLENEQIRSVGGESVVLATIKNLELDKKLESLGFNRPNIEATIGVITARLLAPASEYATHTWLQNDTSLDDLMDTSFEFLSQDRVYSVSDMLLKNKNDIETHLKDREKHLFNLGEKVLLYDLTNTFFEGSGKYNEKAHFGVSKEKRTDCPLITLGLLMDSDGFPKKSEVFEGNISEAGTLEKILSAMSDTEKNRSLSQMPGSGRRRI